MIRYVWFENDFIVTLFFMLFLCDVRIIVVVSISIRYFFLILFFSFAVMEVV